MRIMPDGGLAIDKAPADITLRVGVALRVQEVLGTFEPEVKQAGRVLSATEAPFLVEKLGRAASDPLDVRAADVGRALLDVFTECPPTNPLYPATISAITGVAEARDIMGADSIAAVREASPGSPEQVGLADLLASAVKLRFTPVVRPAAAQG